MNKKERVGGRTANPGQVLPLDEILAVGHRVPLLITATTFDALYGIALRIHRAQVGRAPFVHCGATRADILLASSAGWLRRAAGGSLLMSEVEALQPDAQSVLLGVLDLARRQNVRMISGTTGPLFERVVAGTFSEILFYRLNVIHLVVSDPAPDDDREDHSAVPRPGVSMTKCKA